MRTSLGRGLIVLLLLIQVCWVFTPIVLTGPLFPMMGALWLSMKTGRHLTRNAILFWLLMGLQVLSFVPVIIAAITIENPDLEVWLYPMLAGGLLYLGTLAYVVWEYLHFLPSGHRPS